jgi:hypothetical protein
MSDAVSSQTSIQLTARMTRTTVEKSFFSYVCHNQLPANVAILAVNNFATQPRRLVRLVPAFESGVFSANPFEFSLAWCMAIA